MTMIKDHFEYFQKNCVNYRKTKWSDSIKSPWMYRCDNFEKDNSNLSNTCYNCRYKKFKD